MGEIRIQDTGYIKPTNEGTQASSGNRANNGTVITLKTGSFVPVLKRNKQDNPNLSSNSPSEISKGSLENMKFDLQCTLDTKNSVDMNILQHLLNCISTNSYLLMWYQYTNATTEKNNGQLIFQIANNSLYGHQLTNGEKTAFSISDNFYHLHIHLYEAVFRHSANSLLHYTFKGTVLKVEESSI